MDERGIIIADRDAEYRSQIADHFTKAGYCVETTDSAVHVLCSILEKQTPVLLLGSDFDQKICSADLIHLLKKCNRHLAVIMVSDAMPLSVARKVRQEGIFYHALKPAAASDTEELGMAVKCAFDQDRGSVAQVPQEQAPQSQQAYCEDAPKAVEPVNHASIKASWVIGLATLIFGISYLSLLAAERMEQGSSTAIWTFLGFCALIIMTQLLPIFHIKLPAIGSEEHPAKQERAPLDKK